MSVRESVSLSLVLLLYFCRYFRSHTHTYTRHRAFLVFQPYRHVSDNKSLTYRIQPDTYRESAATDVKFSLAGIPVSIRLGPTIFRYESAGTERTGRYLEPWRMEWLDLQGRVRAMKQTAKEMDYFMSKWLEEHIQKRQNGDVKEEESDFMDVMLSLLGEDELVEGHKSGTVIKATTQLFILASFETPSITMIWALTLLLNHNKALKLVQEELDTHVGRQRWVEESDINNLPYLRAIVKETLRLYPPGPLSVPREALSDCHVAGYHVSKGTCLIVNLWKLHRDPNIWTNPNEFQPKRFLSENVKMDVKGQCFEYLPYSAGRRMCPGVTVSLQMMHLVLGRMLQGFDLATPMLARVDMAEGLGLALPKATPLEVMLIPRLPHKLYQE